MRLLLDTHLLVGLTRPHSRELSGGFESILAEQANTNFVSAASLWEIAIKTRLNKLSVGVPLNDLVEYFQGLDLCLLAVDHRHAAHLLDPEPPTRDPFDRMLLAQCAVEDMRLLTQDRALSAHPLAWRQG